MSNLQRIAVIFGAFACFIGCTGDFLVTFLLGSRYQGYSQIKDTMSSLGASVSPVSSLISFWWIILGGLIIIFAAGFRIAFAPAEKYLKISFWLLVIYGSGEGLGSGFFKADVVDSSFTMSYIIHDILGGAGVLAILLLPIPVQKIFPLSESRCFRRFSIVVLASGILLLLLFSSRFVGSVRTFPVIYTGLWQRLFVLDYYFYLMAIAWIMVKRITPQSGLNKSAGSFV